ncbi:acetyl-CoA carboxylase biotin carboxyl carrier protein [Sabulicella glaciei]|uniref:acetyl-CoA carboxylase biotin carboxyl carrier protein n=1 Tax=Sabulicella glaciei TaxID=2984948 RepID=UPI00266C666C|nr:acetyl-CoA carboxylase biotin carboxyl carrier protein subunit [Roseococcus sp. MDT2-1-1]
MDLAKIKALIDLVSRSGVTELELTEGDTTLKIGRGPHFPPAGRADAEQPSPKPAAMPFVAPSAEPTPSSTRDNEVRAPSFGVFHLTPDPGSPPFVTVGTTVEAGQTLCLIEAMKVFTSLTAPSAGVVQAILAEAGDEIEAGQILFRLRA